MIPWPNRILNGELIVENQKFQLPTNADSFAIHGLLSEKSWNICEQPINSVLCSINLEAPWPFRGKVFYGAKIYQNKQRTKQLMSDAQMHQAEQMAKGEIEYKAKVIESNDNGFKDEFVLILVSIPILLLGWSVFSDDPTIRDRIDLFFEYFKNLPYWYQAIFIGVVSAIYGLKGADIMRKK